MIESAEWKNSLLAAAGPFTHASTTIASPTRSQLLVQRIRPRIQSSTCQSSSPHRYYRNSSQNRVTSGCLSKRKVLLSLLFSSYPVLCPSSKAIPAPSGSLSVLSRAAPVATMPASAISTAIASMAFTIITAWLDGGSESGVFISPVSIYSALALALNAAGPDSTCHSQLRALLSGSQPPNLLPETELNEGLSQMSDMMRTVAGQGVCAEECSGEDEAVAIIANSVWTMKGGVTLKPEYAGLMASLFQATAAEATSSSDINSWVDNVTQGKIKHLLDDGAVFECVLANALYFKGLWKQAFDPRPFTTMGGEEKMLPMMMGTYEKGKRAQVVTSPGAYKAVHLPYRGEKYRALVALPDEIGGDGIKKALKALTDPNAVTEVMTPPKTIVHLPRFKVEFAIELSSILRSMGVEDMFIRGKADFSRLTDQPENLYASSVVHKCVVEVDEEGTVAAAATAIIMLTSAMIMEPTELVFNRPFVFIIEHIDTHAPLFIGTVMDPSE
eukprot:gene6601-3256_t